MQRLIQILREQGLQVPDSLEDGSDLQSISPAIIQAVTARQSLVLYNQDLDFQIGIIIGQVLMLDTNLTVLHLGANNLGSQGGCAIAEALKINTTLSTLNLRYNKLDAQTGTIFAEALLVNKSLTSLNLETNHLGPEGGIAIAEALKVNNTLTSLTLDNNNLNSSVGVAFAESLKVNRTLLKLSLKANHLDFQTGNTIAEALKVNKTLTFLDLESNQLYPEAILAIIEALKVNNSLTFLNLQENNIESSYSEIQAVTLDLLRVNTKLTELYLGPYLDSLIAPTLKRNHNQQIRSFESSLSDNDTKSEDQLNIESSSHPLPNLNAMIYGIYQTKLNLEREITGLSNLMSTSGLPPELLQQTREIITEILGLRSGSLAFSTHMIPLVETLIIGLKNYDQDPTIFDNTILKLLDDDTSKLLVSLIVQCREVLIKITRYQHDLFLNKYNYTMTVTKAGDILSRMTALVSALQIGIVATVNSGVKGMSSWAHLADASAAALATLGIKAWWTDNQVGTIPKFQEEIFEELALRMRNYTQLLYDFESSWNRLRQSYETVKRLYMGTHGELRVLEYWEQLQLDLKLLQQSSFPESHSSIAQEVKNSETSSSNLSSLYLERLRLLEDQQIRLYLSTFPEVISVALTYICQPDSSIQKPTILIYSDQANSLLKRIDLNRYIDQGWQMQVRHPRLSHTPRPNSRRPNLNRAQYQDILPAYQYAIQTLFGQHSNITMITIGYGYSHRKQPIQWDTTPSVLVYVYSKKYIPWGEKPIPKDILNKTIRIMDGICRPEVKNKPRGVYQYIDPIYPGSSIGLVTGEGAGTLGAFLSANGQTYFLINEHVVTRGCCYFHRPIDPQPIQIQQPAVGDWKTVFSETSWIFRYLNSRKNPIIGNIEKTFRDNYSYINKQIGLDLAVGRFNMTRPIITDPQLRNYTYDPKIYCLNEVAPDHMII